MASYIALLRGINVGGKAQVKMADLRKTLEKCGFDDFKTYIQSGNIVFKNTSASTESLAKKIHKAIKTDFDLEVPVLVWSLPDFKSILEASPYLGQENNRQYFVLLEKPAAVELVKAFEEIVFEHEECTITDTCVYLSCHNGYGNAKLNNNLLERKLKVCATTRNLNTMHKLIAMAQEFN